MPVILAWLGLYFVFAFNFSCLSTIIRRQWADSERLTYPITRLPLAMTNPGSNFFRNRRMWIGFGIAAGISLMNGLSFLYPTLPSFDVTRHYFPFNAPPLSFYEGAMVAFYPLAIGIMFLMPLDVLFSTILFYVLYRNQLALGQAMGWHSLPKFPYRGEQAFGQPHTARTDADERRVIELKVVNALREPLADIVDQGFDVDIFKP